MTLGRQWIALPLAFLAITLGFAVSRGQWLLPAGILTLTALLLATLVTDTLPAILLVVAALLEPPLGDFGGIPELKLAELVAPILLLVLALRAASRERATTALAPTRVVDLDRSRAINLAVGAYAVVLALNYLRSKYLLGSTVFGTARTFYDYFIALGTYLLFYLLLTARGCDWSRLFRFLFWLSLTASTIGVLAVALKLPLNFGTLRYSVYDYTSGAVRVGFLETFGTVGLALVLTINNRFRLVPALLFVVALLASGGRAAVIGAAVAIAVYFLITRRSWRVLAGTIVAILVALAIPSIGSNPQVQRLSQVNQQQFSSDGRLYIYNHALDAFASEPLVGTGVGVPVSVSSPEPKISAFYAAQLEVGGHATYVSLLKNLGLLGFVPFVAALLIALASLAPIARADPAAGFFFILLVAEAIAMFVEGNGSDPVYFFALAGASAVLASRRRAPWSAPRVRDAGPQRFTGGAPAPPTVGP
jgi:O-antigen ligase